jgi:hypothetical protein
MWIRVVDRRRNNPMKNQWQRADTEDAARHIDHRTNKDFVFAARLLHLASNVNANAVFRKAQR